MVGGGSSGSSQPLPDDRQIETYLYQLKGGAKVVGGGVEEEVGEGECCVVGMGEGVVVEREAGSVGLFVMQKPGGNRAK